MSKFTQYQIGELIPANSETHGQIVGVVTDYRMRYNEMIYYVTLVKPIVNCRWRSRPRYSIIVKQSEILEP